MNQTPVAESSRLERLPVWRRYEGAVVFVLLLSGLASLWGLRGVDAEVDALSEDVAELHAMVWETSLVRAEKAERAGMETQLAGPLHVLRTRTATCATSPTALHPTTGTEKVSSMMVINTSATAIYVGGSDVDGSTAGTTGIDVCDGCTAGKTLSMDVREAWCVVASGTVSAEVVYGAN